MRSAVFFASLALVACAPTDAPPPAATAAAAAELSTDDDKTLYALGLAIGQNVRDFNLTSDEVDIVAHGLRDSVLGNEPKVDARRLRTAHPGPRAGAHVGARPEPRSRRPTRGSRSRRRSPAPSAAPRASSSFRSPKARARTRPATSTVRVHYHGTLRDGTVFDSSVDRGEPISFPLTGVIRCWTEGVQKIKVGGKAKLVCPSDTAYGDQGSGSIPGGAALAFEVELLAIE